ncbi:MAG: hypothetical protein CMB76_03910 [Euryarchaeota archaeon]|nr:hypothetical protein [Euryarchaeota archaeon]
MRNQELRDFISLVKSSVSVNLKFTGFSDTAIEFFNDLPSKPEAPDWLRKKKESGDFDVLKSEFIDLVHDLCKILCLVDVGFEDDLSGNKIIGRETLQGAGKGQSAPITGHHWCAMHTKGKPKTEDTQFFINHTSLGLRVGIYDKRHDDSKRWNNFLLRLNKNKEGIFEEYSFLHKEGFEFVKTPKDEYFNHAIGKVFHPKSAQEMYQFVCDSNPPFKQSFGILKLIPHSQMKNSSLIDIILECFVDTRAIYEKLQPSRFDFYKREITSIDVLKRRKEEFNHR